VLFRSKNLSEEDQFMFSLTKVERLSQKLNIMNFIGNFQDVNKNLSPQINAVISASLSIKQSKKLRKLLEIILAFGNYMNSSKRGPVYGFKLQSLETLLDTKTQDKKQTLLHYITQTINLKFPEISNFESELTFIDKASTVSLENVLYDMNELEKGMKMTRKEYEIRLESKTDVSVLNEFFSKADSQFQELTNKFNKSQDLFNQCVEYFGEAPRSQSPNTFFTIFVKFNKAYNQAKLDNEARSRSESIIEALGSSSPKTITSGTKNNSKDLVNELKKRQPNGRIRPNSKKEINIEDLIEEINRGYVTEYAEKRKRQRTQEIKKDAMKASSPVQIM